MKIKIIYILLSLIIIAGSFATYLYFSKDNSKDSGGSKDIVSPGDATDKKVDRERITTVDGFTLETVYKDESIWEYTLTGSLPNPCYKYESDLVIRESYPEQVVMTVVVTPPAEEAICVEVIKNVDEKGSYIATGDSTIELKVERKEPEKDEESK